ncbi:PDZ domain-containing protein [Planctomyces sp. SH-PL14]|uniref:PDZ domain-containing protein n=1 Tax=Planctomyces sp. SH-PL14 TaxID=1632864 RepID=UPI0009ED674C|nr:PDZ domain-containing protein [Planctomyces sp. SH-PL14]
MSSWSGVQRLGACMAIMLTLASPAPPPALAQSTSLDLQEEAAFKQAATLAEPSIVQIQTVGGLDVVDQILVASGPTTGVIVSDDGYVITSSFNFLNKPSSVIVLTADGKKYPAEIIAADKARKLTLLRIEARGLTPLPAAPKSEFRVGQWSIALGRTFDLSFPSLSVGVLSALDRIYGRAVQTDAKISPVNYGGPIVDVQGRGIGLLVPMSPQEDAETAGVEWYDGGIGFAVPMEDIYRVLPRLKTGETLMPGLMGVSFSDISPLAGEARVDRVRPESPGAKAGLKVGDVIVEIDGHRTERIPALRHYLGNKNAGETIRVVARRGEESITAEIKLADVLLPYESGYLGVLPERVERDAGAFSGAGVRDVLPGSPAEGQIARGDRIVGFGDAKIATAEELLDRVSRVKPGETASVRLLRGGQERTVELKLKSIPNEVPAELSPSPIPSRPAEVGLDGRQIGRFEAQIAGEERKFWMYVPDDYNPRHEYAVLVWIHPPGDTLEADFLKAWQVEANRRGVILVGPRAEDLARWTPDEADYVKGIMEWVREQYSVDEKRIVVHGHRDGGFAWLVGFRQRETFGGLMISGTPLKQAPADNDPATRQQILLIASGTEPVVKAIQQTAAGLQRLKFPATLIEGTDGNAYPTDQVEAMARWIDLLDRI